MNTIFGHRWESQCGTAPMDRNPETGADELTIAGETWGRALAGITPRQVADGLNLCVSRALAWPPTPGEFRGMCLGLPTIDRVRLELRHPDAASPFTRLVWQHIDCYAWGMGDDATRDRLARAAYAEAHEAAVKGAPLPPPVPALTAEDKERERRWRHGRADIPQDPAERLARLASLNRVMSELLPERGARA